ncbi:non-ribosomal peptide synthetase [Oligoflexus tunisiensis]|uniref:non-ribosomal peptide synthetase n=1 Tax=Oligoflexus tunisiensis TaxID=708132 RepID=UPI001C403647|nr:non-ribosomal peptide synthetase [Oligoflexus tunisiensis]
MQRLVCSVPLPRGWQGNWQNTNEPPLEAALIRITETWDAARFEKKMQAVTELFPLLRASLSPQHKAISIRENQKINWRLLDQSELLEQVLHKGWNSEINALLRMNPTQNQLWEALVAVQEDGEFLVCLVAHPAIADASMLHAALAYLELQFKNQAPSPTQREIMARDRLDILQKTAWTSYHKDTVSPALDLPATLPRKARDPDKGSSCSFRLPAHAWEKMSVHARTLGLPSFTVAAMLMRAALQRLFPEDVGPILYKNSLRFPKSAHVPATSGWEAISVPCTVEQNFTDILSSAAQTGWVPMSYPEAKAWADGLWVGVGLLPSSSEAQQLRILSTDAGPTSLLWLCPDGDGETFLTWTDGAWDAEFPLSLAAILKELAEMWSESLEQPLKALPIDHIVLPLWQRWNNTYEAWPLEQTIPQLLAMPLQKAGDAVAIRSRSGDMSYRQLDMQSKQLALWLRAKGVGPGDLVGIALPRIPGMLVALLGVLRSGAGYVPLDPAFPAERLQYMLNDAKVKGCICEAVMEPLVESSCEAWIWNEVQQRLPEHMADQWQDPGQDPSSIAYVIYTSGSTGQPKGVMLGHRSVVNFLLSMQQCPGLDRTDRVLAITTLSFDIAVLELLLPLLCGASLYLVNAEEGKDGSLLRSLVEEEGITLFQATPSNFRLLLDAGWKGSKIRKALCGGEPFPIDVARRLLPIVDEVWNMYGPTETTVWSTVHRIQKLDGIVPIGRPIANTGVFILDEQLKPVLPGEKGEIYIAGSGLALGYLGRPDLTAERFQMIPSLAALAYKTGDIGRFMWNGELEIFGRADHQVKLRGYRMELGEVEAVLATLPGIEQCMAAVKDFGPDDPRLVAYVTTTAPLDERKIRQLAREKLPNYMLPAHYVVLPKMPLLPNGKTDRKQLPHPLEMRSTGAGEAADNVVPIPTAVHSAVPAPQAVQPSLAEPDMPPSGAAASVEQISVTTRTVAPQNPMASGTTATPKPYSAASTPAPTQNQYSAASMDFSMQATAPSPAPYAPEIQLVTPHQEAPVPITPSQARMLFVEDFYPGTTVHNLAGAWLIQGVMDFQAFRRALETLIMEQDSLRMAVVQTEAGYELQISPPFAPELRIYGREKSNMTLDEVKAAIVKLSQERIDPMQVPNFRMGIFRLHTDATVFFLITHHIFWDGFSYGVLWKNIQRLYKEVLVSGRAFPQPPAFNYSHYAVQRQEELKSPHVLEAMDYWRKVYQDLPEPLELPYDFSRPAQLHHAAATAWIPWDRSVDTRLQQVAKIMSCSVYHVLLSAYYALLYRLSGQNDLVVGTPVHGRQQVEVFELLGNFINVVALRQKLDADMTFVQLVERVKVITTEGMTHSDLPFENLVAALKLPRDAGRTPLYNTMFFYQDQSLQRIQFGSTQVENLRLSSNTVDTDLILWVERYAQNTYAGFNFRVDLWEQGTVESFGQTFRQLLDALLANPEQTLLQPTLVSPSQLEDLILKRNQSILPEPADKTLPDIMEARARATPEQVAVRDLNGGSISWRELDHRSKQLAQVLRQKGVQPGSIVGICHSRKLDLIIGMLATLRAGAAYLPLDPFFPVDRLTYMIEDAQAKLILTESALVDLLRGTTVPLLCLDRDKGSWSHLNPDHDQGPRPAPTDLAYIIYTSGSTGKPKGVEIQHQAVACFLNSFQAAVEMPKDLRTLAITTISFDISVLEIFGTLAWGGTVTLVEQEKVMDGPALIKALNDHHINLLQATPATWRLLLESRWFGQSDLTALCGGEALPRDLARELLSRTRVLWNVYGPTEATVWATVSRIENAEAPITIGRVLPQYEAYILDDQKRPLPAGVIGSLYLGGPALARAYRNRADLTAEKFIPHPFKANARVYDTGDLCRYRADGQIEYVSRKDNQIKLRGFRIELGEIESCMANLPEIKQAVVIVREDQPGDQRLVAYAVCHEGRTMALPTLLQNLRQNLPPYMLPNHLVILPQFPLTGSGKIDKKALPAPQPEREASAGTAKGSGETFSLNEELLAAIWRDMIGIQKVRRSDNFFDLGGHSLLALKVLHRCQQELGASFKVRDLLLMNLAQLASQLPGDRPANSRITGERS